MDKLDKDTQIENIKKYINKIKGKEIEQKMPDQTGCNIYRHYNLIFIIWMNISLLYLFIYFLS